MSFTRPFLLGPAFLWTALPCSDGYHLESGGINLKRAQMSSIWAKECMLMIVCVI